MFLSQIYIYPIKSTRGIPVPETALDITGPLPDRRWMLVDDEGVFLSQRRLPRMALISPHFEGTDLVVTAPNMTPLVISRWSGEGDWVPVRIWRDALQLPHPNPRYSEWFSSYLGESCRLVHLPDTVVRPVETPFNTGEWRVNLADGYPLLVVTQASLDLLNERLPAPVAMERFRPSLVISGTAAHEEDHWRRLGIGGVELAIVKPCARCPIVLVDPSTAQSGVEPLRTLARYRKTPKGVMFAQNALIVKPGLLQTGAAVEVVERTTETNLVS